VFGPAGNDTIMLDESNPNPIPDARKYHVSRWQPLLRRGQVEVTGSPEAMGYCHCGSCRSWSGGPVNAFTLL